MNPILEPLSAEESERFQAFADLGLADHYQREAKPTPVRTLRSDKFKHKRGQRVPVSEAWVGPAEWVGLDGKVYKVML